MPQATPDLARHLNVAHEKDNKFNLTRVIYAKSAAVFLLVFYSTLEFSHADKSHDLKNNRLVKEAQLKEIQAQKVDSAFEGSKKSYNLFSYLKKQEKNFLDKFIMPDAKIKGFFRFRDSDFLSKQDPCLKDFLTIEDYDIEGFSCVNSNVGESLPIDDCKMFVVVYKPLTPSLPPVIAVKGTSTFGDVMEDLKLKGGGYLSHLLDPVKTLVPGFKEAAKAFTDGIDKATRAAYDSFSADHSLNQQYVEALNAFAARYSGRQLLFTGHSLGGSLASNLADAYTKSQPKGNSVQVDLITFNSLAPSESLKYFYKKNDLRSKEASTRNPNIKGLNFFTYDDPLHVYNHIKDGTFFGQSIPLSSQRNTDQNGRTKGSLVSGHYMTSLASDIDFTRRRKEAIEYLRNAKDALAPSRDNPHTSTATKRIRIWGESENEEFRRNYDQNIQADHGKDVVPILLTNAENTHTAAALGSPSELGIIDNSKMKNGTKKVIYDTKEPKKLSAAIKGCESFKL